MLFDRSLSYGKRLDIPAGSATRFEPGESKTVTLVSIGGNRCITGGNNLASGTVNPDGITAFVTALVSRGFAHAPADPSQPAAETKTYTMSREVYADFYGPTVGDLVRLGDTQLWARVENDYTVYGDECKFGGGKVLREGMGQQNGIKDDGALDLVITNALIIDYTGIYKVGDLFVHLLLLYRLYSKGQIIDVTFFSITLKQIPTCRPTLASRTA